MNYMTRGGERLGEQLRGLSEIIMGTWIEPTASQSPSRGALMSCCKRRTGDPPVLCEPCPHTLCRGCSGLQKNRAQSSHKHMVFVLRYL